MTIKELCKKYDLSTSVIERLRTKVIRGETSEQDFILELEKKSESKKEYCTCSTKYAIIKKMCKLKGAYI